MAKNKEECLQMVAEEVKNVRSKYEPTLTQAALGKKIKRSMQGISNIENGKYLPAIETLVDIAQATRTNLIIAYKTDEQLMADEELKKLISKTQ